MRCPTVAAGVLALALGLAPAWGAAEVVAVVSAKSPVSALAANQAADIFLGKSSRFPDGEAAVPIDRAEGSAARDEFYGKLTGKSPAQMKAHWAKIIFTGRGQPPREASSNGELKKLLTENPAAIGYMDRSAVDASLRIVLTP